MMHTGIDCRGDLRSPAQYMVGFGSFFGEFADISNSP